MRLVSRLASGQSLASVLSLCCFFCSRQLRTHCSPETKKCVGNKSAQPVESGRGEVSAFLSSLSLGRSPSAVFSFLLLKKRNSDRKRAQSTEGQVDMGCCVFELFVERLLLSHFSPLF